MSTKRARSKAVISVLAAKFPKCFAAPDTRRRPLKVGIDADLLAALGGTIRRTELIRALAMYCSSTLRACSLVRGASTWKASP
jgi:sRNA-binding protein